jgi:hypothetical protein
MTTILPIRRAAFAAILLAAAGAASATSPATAPTPAPAPAATPAPAAAPAAPAAPARVAVGGEIPFDALVDYIGARIRVHTKIRTVREGELTGASSVAFNVKLDADVGGLNLAMPRENVLKVELLAEAPAKP